MHQFDNHPEMNDTQDALLDDLEVRCTTNVAELREAKAPGRPMRVEVHAANACDRDGAETELQAGDTGDQGLSGIAPKPVMVGSVFQLRFDRATTDLPPALAVCERCTMLSDTSFELRFRFAHPVDLS
ncbi:MAG: hypothetical protein ACE37K_21405 [Planctomycetota bacterium]